ncbi:hypothetical protein BDZ89DRAFT_1045393 [Hymenopellis radicata]|nr:hypothetical protein BDZ89DRAFT_1045393 [Hymenopellis radicata]
MSDRPPPAAAAASSPRRRGRAKGPKSPPRRLTLKSRPLIVARGLGKINFPLSPFSSRKLTFENRVLFASIMNWAPPFNIRVGSVQRYLPNIAPDTCIGQQPGNTTFTPVEEPTYIKPADPRFIHDEVGRFLEAYNVLSLEKRFLAMGIYTHDDLITVAVDIRGDQSLRKEFRAGVEASDDDWRRLKRGIYRYARPVSLAQQPIQADIPAVAAEEVLRSRPEHVVTLEIHVVRWVKLLGYCPCNFPRLFVMGRLTFDPSLVRYNGDKYFFREDCPFDRVGEPYERAQRIVRRFTATLPPFVPPPGSESAMEQDLVEAFSTRRGAYLLPRLADCGVMSTAHLGRVWRLCRNYMFVGYLRMALAISVAGKNWNVLNRMGMRLIDFDNDEKWDEEGGFFIVNTTYDGLTSLSVVRFHREDIQKSKEEATIFLNSCQDIMNEVTWSDPVRAVGVVTTYDASCFPRDEGIAESVAALRIESDEEEAEPLIIHRMDGEFVERLWAPQDDDDAPAPVTGKRKRKHYQSSDEPMEARIPWLSAFLEETMRRHGLGSATDAPQCSSCGVLLRRGRIDPDATSMDVDGQVYVDELYRCTSCEEFLECSSCSLARHKQSPMHSIRVWRNFTWECTSLTEMGLVFQLGHQGAACRVPDAAERRMTVLHLNGVHTVAFRYCGCAVSDREHHWQQLMRCGWYPASTPATCATTELLSLLQELKPR